MRPAPRLPTPRTTTCSCASSSSPRACGSAIEDPGRARAGRDPRSHVVPSFVRADAAQVEAQADRCVPLAAVRVVAYQFGRVSGIGRIAEIGGAEALGHVVD